MIVNTSQPPLQIKSFPETVEPMQQCLRLALLTGGLLAASWALQAAAGEEKVAPPVFENSGDTQSLEARLRKAYDEFQKKSAADQKGTDRQSTAGEHDPKGTKGGKPQDDPEYKEKIAANQARIKELFALAEENFNEKKYRESAQYYASVVMANAPKTEQQVEDSRKRFIEMEGMAQQYLKNADDADIGRDFVKEVNELAIVVKEFPFTKVYPIAQRRLVALKTRPDVAGTVEMVEAEALEVGGDVVAALKQYKSISVNPRYENSLSAMKAKRKLELLNKDEAVLEKVKSELQTRAENDAPPLFNSAKNFLANNMPAKAKEKLRAVVERFPGTSFAVEAAKQLDQIP